MDKTKKLFLTILFVLALLSIIVLGGCRKTSTDIVGTIDPCYQAVEIWQQMAIDCIHAKDDDEWYCVEWRNKTTINPLWLDNCCVDLGLNLDESSPSKTFPMNVDNETELELKVTLINATDRAYSGLSCFDFDEVKERAYKSLSVGSEEVNISKCQQTPKYIETNKSECVTMKRKTIIEFE